MIGHTHEPYPQFSVECLKDLLRIIRGGTVREELALFAKCLYSMVGAALSATIGDPPGPMASVERQAEPTTEELEECHAALASMREDGHGIYGSGEAAIDPATLTILINLAVQLITAWLAKRKTA